MLIHTFFGYTYVSNKSTCDARGSTVDTPQSGTGEIQSSPSLKASLEHNGRPHQGFLASSASAKLWVANPTRLLTLEIAHVSAKR